MNGRVVSGTMASWIAIAVTQQAAVAQAPATTLVSVAASGGAASGNSVAISRDGRHVAYYTYGTGSFARRIVSRDRVTFGLSVASVNLVGAESIPADVSEFGTPVLTRPAISGDGRFVAFASSSVDLVPGDTNDKVDVFVRDFQLGTTERVSVSSAGAQASGHSGLALFPYTTSFGGPLYMSGMDTRVAISDDGRVTAFSSLASDLVPNDANFTNDVFVHDRITGVTELISATPAGNSGNGRSVLPAISADGRYVAFASQATNILPGSSLTGEVFVRDRVTGTTIRASLGSGGVLPNNACAFTTYFAPPVQPYREFVVDLGLSISADGRVVAFGSWATNLSPSDSNNFSDVYVRDLAAGVTTLVSARPDGLAGNADSSQPALSNDGRFVAFQSRAGNLVAGDVSGTGDTFRRDVLRETTSIESVDANGNQVANGEGLEGPALAGDGAQVAFTTWKVLAAPDAMQFYDAYARGAPVQSATTACEGIATSCPCSNGGALGNGCANSESVDGSNLDATGSPSVSVDTLALTARGLPQTAPITFVQGATSQSSTGAPVYGDGVLCVIGPYIRLGTRIAANGVARLGVAGDPGIAAMGGVPAAGGDRHYAAVYRDAAAFCTTATFNATNSLRVVWGL